MAMAYGEVVWTEETAVPGENPEVQVYHLCYTGFVHTHFLNYLLTSNFHFFQPTSQHSVLLGISLSVYLGVLEDYKNKQAYIYFCVCTQFSGSYFQVALLHLQSKRHLGNQVHSQVGHIHHSYNFTIIYASLRLMAFFNTISSKIQHIPPF